MALLVIRGPDGRPQLIHSGAIGRATGPNRSRGSWAETWRRFDRLVDESSKHGAEIAHFAAPDTPNRL